MDAATSARPPARPAASAQWETYWPEIDGLRTIAVVSVLAFHFNPKLLNGGFVGVDIFFVISGYLITGLLIRDFESGDSIIRFYQRRIARIAPASFLVVAITITAAFFVYSAQDFASVGATGLDPSSTSNYCFRVPILRYRPTHSLSFTTGHWPSKNSFILFFLYCFIF
jgi:peptidoglycan/LPS O-acetylase OafA/YrhL